MQIAFKTVIITTILVTTPQLSKAHPDLVLLNKKRMGINQAAMLTLGGWALMNMTAGGILMTQENGEKKYFHQMNLCWNVINLGIAGFGYYGSHNQTDSLSLAESIREQFAIEKILLLNTGLDVAYVATGLFLLEKRSSDPRLKGYGRSLILQGSFLFVFDLILYFVHNRNQERYFDLLQHAVITSKGVSVQIYF